MKKILPVLFTILLFVSCSQETEVRTLVPASPETVSVSAERLARIDRVLQQAVDSGWIAGATAFIARDSRVVYDKAFGYSDVEAKTPLTTGNIFRIASQTKAITSVAVMMLFEEGKFLLDDPVSLYIPEFAKPGIVDKYNPKDTTWTTIPAKREVTVRDLLTHTSGIDYAGIGSGMMNAIYAKAGIPTGFVSEKLVLGEKIKALGKLPLVHNPGERFTYGLNTDVLGYLVEVWSGESFDMYLKKHLFEPLGMTDTWFYLPEDKAARLVKVAAENKDRSLGNFDNDFVNYPLVDGTYFSGGAGLSSTTRDYAIFLQMLLNNGEYNGTRILARRTVDLMTCNQIGDLDLGADKFGLGFQVTTAEGQKKYGTTEGSFGWGGYFATIYWADPQEKLVCLLFFQHMGFSHGELHEKFRTMVYQALDD